MAVEVAISPPFEGCEGVNRHVGKSGAFAVSSDRALEVELKDTYCDSKMLHNYHGLRKYRDPQVLKLGLILTTWLVAYRSRAHAMESCRYELRMDSST